MSEENKENKNPIAQQEEEILKFWKDNQIFEKTLKRPSPKGEFVFYDGPPFATGLPHYGNLLSSIIKDVIPRYKTMRGFNVKRRWGWDCHGLPIESLVEKKLKLKTKKDIENIGVEEFNKTARGMVLEYAKDWEKYIDRIGRWVEFEDSYKTMDNSYIESIWWALRKIHEKGLLYEGRKVLMYCPHCETPLAKAEIAMDNSYKDVTEEAVTVKFKLNADSTRKICGTDAENAYLLAWTTTPWTLPGNVALAVGKDIGYTSLRLKGIPELLIVASELVSKIFGDREIEIVHDDMKGIDLVGLEYESLFDIPKIRESDKAYKVYSADFVNTEDGTGIVHTAVMYGEDDFLLGQREDLPMVPLLDASGHYNENALEFLRGKYIKKGEKEIKDYLEKENLLFEKSLNTHSYPHCYRCGTPLIYNALTSWFINIQKVKKDIIKNNEKINWFPEHLKHGRFGKNIESAPDWTISRNRYWASPLPIWRNNKTGEITVLGAVSDFKKYAKQSGNKYFLIRHGEAESNLQNIVSALPNNPHHITEKGREEVKAIAKILKDKEIDLIFSSDFLRTKETVDILVSELGIQNDIVSFDERLREINTGEFNLKPISEYRDFFSSTLEKLTKRPPGGENLLDVKKRVGAFLKELEDKFEGKNILIVSHEYTIWMMDAVANGWDDKQSAQSKDFHDDYIETGNLKTIDYLPLPRNEDYELDLHRPYVDEIELKDKDGEKLERIPEVVDCWLESGGMPFAQFHYPFENKEEFENRFPGDFIAEYIAQTRTWFYYTHALGTILFDSPAFKNVVTTGTVLSSDGSKMSKSKGNYTDPLINIDKFSADAVRFYLMSSVVMQAEDLNFREEELREAHNRVIGLLWNTFKFYELYKSPAKEVLSENVLDIWIESRLNQVIKQVTEGMEEYNTVKATRLIPKFIDDFSTWYIRRSRDRFKNNKDIEDRNAAIFTTRKVLFDFCRVIAPFTPFLAETIYQGVKSEQEPESVHLCEFPEAGKIDEKIISDMEEIRKVVSLALERRVKANVKVRQPLGGLKIRDTRFEGCEDLLEIIKNEINVREINFDKDMEDEINLDTKMTPELLREGMIRDFARQIQDLRKKTNLDPFQNVTVLFDTDKEGQKFIQDFENSSWNTLNTKLSQGDVSGGVEVKVGEIEIFLSIKD